MHNYQKNKTLKLHCSTKKLKFSLSFTKTVNSNQIEVEEQQYDTRNVLLALGSKIFIFVHVTMELLPLVSYLFYYSLEHFFSFVMYFWGISHDIPTVVCNHRWVPLALIPSFHCWSVLMEALSVLVKHRWVPLALIPSFHCWSVLMEALSVLVTHSAYNCLGRSRDVSPKNGFAVQQRFPLWS